MVQARKKQPAPRPPRPRTPRQAAARRTTLDKLLAPEVFKALGDPVRARLLACVAKCGRACSVGEVAQCCELDLSTVSRHLAQLARAGVMQAVKRGTTVLYSVRHAELSTRLRELADALDACAPDPTCEPCFPKDACCGD